MHVTRRVHVRRLGPDRHLVVHATTGAIHVFSDAQLRVLAALRAGRPPSRRDRPLVRELRRLGYVYASAEAAERRFVKACRASLAWFLASTRRSYALVLDTQCNFDCAYCFEDRAARGRRGSLSPAQIEAALALVEADAAEHGPGVQVELFGGEPLLPRAVPVVEGLLARLAPLGARVSVTTNGYHLDAFGPCFAQHREQLDTVQVTLDGLAPAHDARRVLRSGRPTFDRIVRNVDALRARLPSVRIVVRVNVDLANVGELPPLARFFAERGWTGDARMSFVASPVEGRQGSPCAARALPWADLFQAVRPLSRDGGGGPFELFPFRILNHFRSEFSALAHRREPPPFRARVKRCEATTLRQLYFHPDGRLYPCPEVLGRAERAIGRYEPALVLDPARVRAWTERSILTERRCRRCDVSTFCGGPCPVHAQAGGEPSCDDGPAILDAYLDALGGASRG